MRMALILRVVSCLSGHTQKVFPHGRYDRSFGCSIWGFQPAREGETGVLNAQEVIHRRLLVYLEAPIGPRMNGSSGLESC